MEIDYGDKRSQIIIAGILVIVIVAIFVGFALVVGVLKTYSQNSILPLYDNMLNSSEIGTFRQDIDVLAGKSDCMFDVPTAAGEISYLSANFPPETWTELPLCITDADIANWYITLYVSGGYEPVCSSITFTQEGVDQYIYISWSDTDYCCYTEWTATFVTDDGCIEFMSSQDPVINLPFSYTYCGVIGDKLVDICWSTSWIGCDFYIMLIHKKCQTGVPQLPIIFHRQL